MSSSNKRQPEEGQLDGAAKQSRGDQQSTASQSAPQHRVEQPTREPLRDLYIKAGTVVSKASAASRPVRSFAAAAGSHANILSPSTSFPTPRPANAPAFCRPSPSGYRAPGPAAREQQQHQQAQPLRHPLEGTQGHTPGSQDNVRDSPRRPPTMNEIFGAISAGAGLGCLGFSAASYNQPPPNQIHNHYNDNRTVYSVFGHR